MKRFLPPHAIPVAFGFLVSGLMTFIVSGISVFEVAGGAPTFLEQWFSAWGASWVVAFPALLLVGPLVRWLLARVVVREEQSGVDG